jgi:hypothetical protein
MAGDIDEIDGYSDDYSSDDSFNSDILVEGDGSPNVYPTVSTSPSVPDDGGYSGTLQNILGSVGDVINNLPQTAKNLGTAVGSVKHTIDVSKTNYKHAETAAASGNNLGTWWQYASTTDKLMIGLAVVGIFVALKGK